MANHIYKIPSFILVFVFLIFEGAKMTLIPSFSGELTSQNFIDLSTAQYAFLHAPFSIMSLVGALFSGYFIKKKGLYSTFTFAIVLDLGSTYFFGMALISSFFKQYVFTFLCIALALSGAGFGMILPLVNTYISQAFPKKTTSAIIALYASFGFGSFILNLFIVYLKQYIGIGISVLALFLILFFFVFSFYEVFPKVFTPDEKNVLNQNIWSLIASMVCVGVLEGLFINWSVLFGDFQGINTKHIFIYFLLFFTLSRFIYAILLYWFPLNVFFILIPIFLAGSLFLGHLFFSTTNAWAVFSIIACFLSANVPFIIAYGKKMFGVKPIVWGLLIAFYNLGDGISSYGLGGLSLPILNHFLSIAFIFALLVIVFNVFTVITSKRVNC